MFKGKSNKKSFAVSTRYLLIIFMLLNMGMQIFRGYFLSGSMHNSACSNIIGIILQGNNSGLWLTLLALILKDILIVALVYLFLWTICKFFTRRICGINGDILGGVGVLTEIFFLLLNYLSIKFLAL